MLKIKQRLKRHDELRVNCFKFMGDLFRNGYAIAVDPLEAERFGNVWYQSHFLCEHKEQVSGGF